MTERVGRWSRGLASLALLVGLVVGVPTALVVLGGNPLPRRWDPAGLWAVLLRPDDGTVLARLLALVGWAAWVVFTASLLVELVNLVRRRSSDVVLPGLGGVQQWAAGLMLAVVALGGAAQLTSGPAAPTAVSSGSVPGPDRPDGAPTAADRAVPVPATPGSTAPAEAAAPGVVDPAAAVPLDAPRGRRERIHVVRSGDDLWSLAERYYGRGQEWRRIATANPDLLTGGPDRLVVGWRLVVPDDGRAGSAAGPDEQQRSVRVRDGDTLSSVAERALGDADRWTDLYRANRDQLSDPDDLPVGLSLRLPGGSSTDRQPASDDERSDSDAPRPADTETSSPGAAPPPSVGSETPAGPVPSATTAPPHGPGTADHGAPDHAPRPRTSQHGTSGSVRVGRGGGAGRVGRGPRGGPGAARPGDGRRAARGRARRRAGRPPSVAAAASARRSTHRPPGAVDPSGRGGPRPTGPAHRAADARPGEPRRRRGQRRGRGPGARAAVRVGVGGVAGPRDGRTHPARPAVLRGHRRHLEPRGRGRRRAAGRRRDRRGLPAVAAAGDPGRRRRGGRTGRRPRVARAAGGHRRARGRRPRSWRRWRSSWPAHPGPTSSG